MLSLNTELLTDRKIKYDGTQLSPHWIFQSCDVLGDAVVAFQGEANVKLDHMVDLIDVKREAPIFSPLMLHFLGEWFIDSLDMGILLQHLFVGNVYETLWEAGVGNLSRRGNDIFFKERKLSVSIATRSPVSVLMHMGINVRTEGTPIPTSGLGEMGVEPWNFAKSVLERFSKDAAVWKTSRVKVLSR
jgi:uncharacterized protein